MRRPLHYSNLGEHRGDKYGGKHLIWARQLGFQKKATSHSLEVRLRIVQNVTFVTIPALLKSADQALTVTPTVRALVVHLKLEASRID